MQKLRQAGLANQEGSLNWKGFLATRQELLLTIGALLLVSIPSFGTLDPTILLSDDWSYFATRYVFGNLHPVNLSDRRPLILALYYGLASVFGLNLKYYYFFNFLVLFLSALMVYALVKRAFPAQGWLAGLVALVYLVYPVDYTRTWLIMIYIRFWWLVSLGAIWLLLEYVKTGRIWIYALGMLGIALPLGAYEGQFGIVLLASALIAAFWKDAPVSRRLSIPAGVVGIGIAFFLWRTSLQARLFQINDTYVEALQFSPAVLMERYLYGLYLFFIGWVKPIQAQFGILGFNLLPWLLFYIAVCSAILVWVSSRPSLMEKFGTDPKTASLKPYFTLFLIGFSFWIAGYFPIIALYRPALAAISSRVNSFAIPGAALMLVSAAALGATLLTRSNLSRRFLTIAALVPFILAGIFVQQQVNRENQVKWDTQKKIWKSVFATIPNMQAGSSVVVIIPGYDRLRPFELFPFLSGWEIGAGAQILYNNPEVGGNYYYEDIQPAELLFVKNGFRPIPTDKAIPYKKLIFVYYDPDSETATLVEDLKKTLALPFPVNSYQPQENILSPEPSTETFRWLVE